MKDDEILRWPEVKERVKISKCTVWRLRQKNQFPATRQLGPKAVGWLRSEIDAWIESRSEIPTANVEKNSSGST